MLSVHLENSRVEVRDVPIPLRPPGFALLRLLLAGICNTDLELQRGYYGFVGTPGHEFVAEVVEADNHSLIGKRVVGEINLACGECDWCARDLGRHCPHRTVLGIVKHPGAFQEFFTLPEKNLHVLPDRVSNEQAVFVEPLSAALEILDQAAIPRKETVAVLGDGKLGILIAVALIANGYAVHQFGRHAHKLSISARAGATTQFGQALPAAAFRWVVDATGSSSGIESAIRMVQPRGTVFLKSTVHDRAAIDWASVIVNEITLIGSRCGRFEPAIGILSDGQIDSTIDVLSMISRSYALAEAPEAFAAAAERGNIKILLH
jgi:threonine dehydrogenase-like Zn-dependent dehydrogenase